MVSGANKTFDRNPIPRDSSQPLSIALPVSSDTAIVYQDKEYSYSQLNTFVQAVAVQLQRAGVQEGDLVAVYMGRSVISVASLIAILHLNAVYVPLNIHASETELSQLLDTLELKAALYENKQHFEAYLEPTLAPSVVAVPITLADVSIFEESIDSISLYASQAPAYMIFTSGTTDIPKQVLLSKKNLLNHFFGVTREYKIQASDRLLHVCSLAFDVSIEEIIPTLFSGAKLHILEDGESRNITHIHHVICTEGISVINFPTSLWGAWLDYIGEKDSEACDQLNASHLRLVIIGTESCPSFRLKQWYQLELKKIDCINAYGLTETTITNLISRFPKKYDETYSPNCVGKAIDGASAYVLKPNLTPVLPDEEGELYIGGNAVGLGYANDPAKSKLNFVTDPFSNDPDAIMFKTGDAALIDSKSMISILGRLDRQIKINGKRIELPFIEFVLGQHESVKSCYVQNFGKANHTYLVAYLCLSESHRINKPIHQHLLVGTDEKLQVYFSSLSSNLPEVLRPDILYFCDEMPLTSNGKINAKLLPAPDFDTLLDVGNNLFFTKLEKRSSDIYQCLVNSLGKAPRDLSQSFLQMGGDSISAISLVAELRRVGVHITVQDLLVSESFESLIEFDTTSQSPSESVAPETNKPFFNGIKPKKVDVLELYQQSPNWDNIEYFCVLTHMQKSILYQSLHAGQGQYIEQVEGRVEDLDTTNFKMAWSIVVNRHDMLKSVFNFVLTDQPLLACRKAVNLVWSELDWRDKSEEGQSAALERRLLSDREQAFTLNNGETMRFQLIKVSDEDCHFIWSYHHAILDGWSDVLILDQVFSCYKSLQAGASPESLSESITRTSYKQYHTYLLSLDDLAGVFWRDYLKNLDRHKPWLLCNKNSGHIQATSLLEFALTEQETIGLTAFAQKKHVTLNTLVMSVCALALSSFKGTEQLVMGAVQTIRPTELDAIDEIAGLFINLLPVTFDCRGEQEFTQWLHQQLSAQLERSKHGHLSLSEINRLVFDDEDAPLFDVLFVYENYPSATNPEAASLTNHWQTNFPLSFIVWPEKRLRFQVKYDESALRTEKVVAFRRILGAIINAIPNSKSVRDLTLEEVSDKEL